MALSATPTDTQKKQSPAKPRGFLPDATTQDSFVLIKICSHLGLTYEIRLATFMARESQRRLRVIVRRSANLSTKLREFATQHGVSIEESKT